MDPNQDPNAGFGRPHTEPAPQGTIVNVGDQWAPGVHPAVVSPRSRRLRWGIAGAVVLCVALVTAGGVFVLSGAAGAKSLTASVAPKNAVAFLEVRTDLPGDQHAKLADFMSHFPGFQDRSQFDNALDNILNRLTAAVSPDLQYTSAFKPWMEGEVSLVALPGGTSPSPTQMLPQMGAVAIVALKDRSAAQTWVAGEVTRLGATTSSQTYAGATVYTIGTGNDQGAYAFTDQDLLMGTVAGVEAALDTKTKGSLADNTNYQAAMASISGDCLARFYLDPESMIGSGMNASSLMGSMMGAGGSAAGMLATTAAQLPAWVAGSVQAQSGDLVVNVAMPRPAGSTTADDNHVSRLATILPGSTVGVFEIHSIGKSITAGLASVKTALPSGYADQLKTIDSALALIGGVDWLGDAAVAVTQDGSTFGGGVVVEATDATTAKTKVALITNYATLASGALHITNRSETYKGVDITVMSVPDSTGTPIEVAVAAKDNLILAGYTDAFVKAVIDTTPGTALAAQSDYQAVMSAAGSSDEQSMYVNIPALEDQIGRAVLQSSASRWTTDYKPYFDHLGGMGYSVVGGNTVILRFVVTAK
jgi:hypothetical protein